MAKRITSRSGSTSPKLLAQAPYINRGPACARQMAAQRRKSRLDYLEATLIKELHRRHKIGVGRRDYSDVIRVFPRQTNHVSCYSCVDTFFARPGQVGCALRVRTLFHILVALGALRVAFWATLRTFHLNSHLSIEPTRHPASVLLPLLRSRVVRGENDCSLVRVRRTEKACSLSHKYGGKLAPIDLEARILTAHDARLTFI